MGPPIPFRLHSDNYVRTSLRTTRNDFADEDCKFCQFDPTCNPSRIYLINGAGLEKPVPQGLKP